MAIDCTSKFVFVQLGRHANRGTASAFLVALIAALPYQIPTVLTDHGIQFTFPPRSTDGPTATSIPPSSTRAAKKTGLSTASPRSSIPGPMARWNA